MVMMGGPCSSVKQEGVAAVVSVSEDESLGGVDVDGAAASGVAFGFQGGEAAGEGVKGWLLKLL